MIVNKLIQDAGVDWTQSHMIQESWYSDPETQQQYSSKPLTGKQAKELVQQCKAYVQSLKNGN